MHPIERLRFVARAWDADPELLAIEAADALAGLAGDPRALATSAVRLVELHPEVAPLRWVAARVLGSVDPAGAARDSAEEIAADPTVDELAAAVPAGATVVCTPSRNVLAAVACRPDLVARVVGADRVPSALALSAGGDVTGWRELDVEQAVRGSRLAVLELLAAGPSGCLLDEPASAVLRAASAGAVPAWAVAGVGRVLPAPLFDALARRARGATCWDPEVFERFVGADGPGSPEQVLSRPGCPSPAELAR